jgi:hypothetical protein
MLRTAFIDDCLSQAVVCQWVKPLKENQDFLKNDPLPAELQRLSMKKVCSNA